MGDSTTTYQILNIAPILQFWSPDGSIGVPTFSPTQIAPPLPLESVNSPPGCTVERFPDIRGVNAMSPSVGNTKWHCYKCDLTFSMQQDLLNHKQTCLFDRPQAVLTTTANVTNNSRENPAAVGEGETDTQKTPYEILEHESSLARRKRLRARSARIRRGKAKMVAAQNRIAARAAANVLEEVIVPENLASSDGANYENTSSLQFISLKTSTQPNSQLPILLSVLPFVYTTTFELPHPNALFSTGSIDTPPVGLDEVIPAVDDVKPDLNLIQDLSGGTDTLVSKYSGPEFQFVIQNHFLATNCSGQEVKEENQVNTHIQKVGLLGRRHRASRRGSEFSRACLYCPLVLQTSKNRVEHEQLAHQMNEKSFLSYSKFSCDVCFQIINSRADFVNHFIEHLKSQEVELYTPIIYFLQCDYPGCLLQFRKEAQFTQHLKEHNTNVFHCIKCNKWYCIEEYYNFHLHQMHPPKSTDYFTSRNIMHCRYCPGIFCLDKLKEHSYHHALDLFISEEVVGLSQSIDSPQSPPCSPPQPLLCDLCGKSLSTIKLFEKHQRLTHNINTRTYTCPTVTLHICKICSKRCKCKITLHKHCLRHHTYEHGTICYICDRQFKTLHTLSIHLRRHPETKTSNCALQSVYPCNYCTKVLESSLRRNKHHAWAHPEKHLTARPFLCPVCFLAFHTDEEKEVHYEIHLKWKCNLCNLHHISQTTFDTHMKAHARPGFRPRKWRIREKKIALLKQVGEPIEYSRDNKSITEDTDKTRNAQMPVEVVLSPPPMELNSNRIEWDGNDEEEMTEFSTSLVDDTENDEDWTMSQDPLEGTLADIPVLTLDSDSTCVKPVNLSSILLA